MLAFTPSAAPSKLPIRHGACSDRLSRFANAVRFLSRTAPRWARKSVLLAAILASLSGPAKGEAIQTPTRSSRLSTPENPEVTSALIDIVGAFIAAGENADPAARGKYLGPKVFYYGHTMTREKAVKEIAALYRRWPQRKFALTESIDLFEIPKHRGVYRVTALYEYKFDALSEHLSGKSKLTCIVEHDGHDTRIIGVDEKLENASTEYQKD